MMIIKNVQDALYEVGHYSPEGEFVTLVCDIDGALVCYFEFDEAVSIVGRINGAPVVPFE